MNTIAIIGAMNEEIELLLGAMERVEETRAAGIVFHQGKLHGKDVVVCKSGVGKVNAAVCTQLLVDRFQVKTVLFTGVAGAVDPELNIGDLVVSTDCMQHDMDVTALGFARGVIPFADSSVFVADKKLVEIAEEAASRLFPGKAKQGRVLSGDQFVANRDTVRGLYEELQGACTEMEGAAVAQVCAMNEVPFVVIRSMSDKADGSAHVNFVEFTVQASENSFKLVNEIVSKL